MPARKLSVEARRVQDEREAHGSEIRNLDPEIGKPVEHEDDEDERGESAEEVDIDNEEGAEPSVARAEEHREHGAAHDACRDDDGRELKRHEEPPDQVGKARLHNLWIEEALDERLH